MFSTWFGHEPKARCTRPGHKSVHSHASFRPALEQLEDRRVLSSFHPAVLDYPNGPAVEVTASPAGFLAHPCFPTAPCLPTTPTP